MSRDTRWRVTCKLYFIPEKEEWPMHQANLWSLFRARFLSLFWNVLRNCLSQGRSETGLRSLAVSVFYLCLRQKIVLQVQVLVNTQAPIEYSIFLKTSMIKRFFLFMKCNSNTGSLLQYKRTERFRLVVCYTGVNILFSNFASCHKRDFDDTHPIVSERAKSRGALT